jgi:hypothetical protein
VSRARLDLPNALRADAELAPDLRQRPAFVAVEAEA